MLRSLSFFAILFFVCFSLAGQVRNFSSSGEQITKFDALGNAVDAHDGMIAYFDGIYYLYGTSYDCGFEWNNKTAPFCGFKVYTSKDLVNWKDEGFLFDAKNQVWQTRCDGKTYGCFRPHVVFNRKYQHYVLWINVYDNVVGYRVFTSKYPTGPFTEVAEPKLAINSDKPAAGLNNGDHDLFVDDDGTAYLALTDWRANGALAVEQLTDDYLSGTGKVTAHITDGRTEAPALFKRKGIYYITYSDPNCGYCSGTGTSYKTAPSALGPWSAGKKISDNSCGGQPSFVSTIKLPGDTLYLYGSDLWNNAAKNEALANFYWMPLTFEPDGTIRPMECEKVSRINRKNTDPGVNNTPAFKAVCDISNTVVREQPFTSVRSGKLKRLDLAVLKSGNPNAGLIIDLYELKGDQKHLMKSMELSADSIGWSAKNIAINPNIPVKKSGKYQFVLRTNATIGYFGYARQVAGLDKNTTSGIKFSITVQ